MQILDKTFKPTTTVITALKHLYGLNQTKSRQICNRLYIGDLCRLQDLSSLTLQNLQQLIQITTRGSIGNQLKQESIRNIRQQISLGTFRGKRHQQALPVNGRTRSNAKTQRRLGLKRISQK